MDANQIAYKMKLAAELKMEGKLLHCVQVYNSIINENPEYTDAYFALGELYEALGNIDPAVDMIKDYLRKNPENKEVRIYLSEFLMRNKKWEEADEILSYILPEEEPVISFFLGYSHFMQKDYEVARINFINFLQYGDQEDMLREADLYVAKIDINLGDFNGALGFLKKIETVYTNYWEWNLLISVVYYNLGMYTHALKPVQKALSLNSKERSVNKWAGKIYLKNGEYGKAERQFLVYIEADDSIESDIYTELAEACLKSRKMPEALAYFEIALKLDPGNILAIEGKKNARSQLKKSAADA